MPRNWRQNSALNIGLIVKGLKSSAAYDTCYFDYPYDEIHEFMVKHPDWCKEDLYQNFPAELLDGAKHEVAQLNGSSTEVDWCKILKNSKHQYELGETLEHTGHSLKLGEEMDTAHLAAELRMMSTYEDTGLQLASEIDLTGVEEYQKSGWDVIDHTFGGIPKQGPLVVYGAMGTGKTFWTAKLINEFLHLYPEKYASVFSLEMGKEPYWMRSLNMYPTLEEVKSRLWISGKATDMKSIIAETHTQERVDIIVIDGIADTIFGVKDAGKFDAAYTDVKRLGRLLEIPVVVVAQPNREGKKNLKTHFIDKYDIEWTGAAENAAVQLIGLQYIESELDFEDKKFPVYDEAYYMICWKQRFGWPAQTGPGAVILREYGNKLWEGPALNNALHYPGSYTAVIGEKSRRRKKEE